MRRLAALAYDTLLLIALWLLATVPFVLIAGDTNRHWWLRALFQLYLLAVAFGFLGWFWLHGGQTLGMRAWLLKLIATQPMTWRRALVRFAGAWLSLGFGFLPVLWHRHRLAWHDGLSGTYFVLLPKRTRSVRAAQQVDREPEEQHRGDARAEEGGDPMQQAEESETTVQHVKRKP